MSLDAGVRMEGWPAAMLWDCVLDILAPGVCAARTRLQHSTPSTLAASRKSQDITYSHAETFMDSIPVSLSNVRLFVFEDNEAVISMGIEGRSTKLRHGTRIHRIDLDWLFERNTLYLAMSMLYVGTKEQMADVLTESNVTVIQWKSLLHLIQMQPPQQVQTSMSSCSHCKPLLVSDHTSLLARLVAPMSVSRLQWNPAEENLCDASSSATQKGEQHSILFTIDRALWDRIPEMLRRSLGQQNLCTAQTIKATWIKFGQVCLTASFNLACKEDDFNEASQNYTYTKTQDVWEMLVESFSSMMAEGNLLLRNQISVKGRARVTLTWTTTSLFTCG